MPKMPKMNSQARLLRLVELLAEDILQGKSNKDLASSVGKTHDIISRDLACLKEAGWAEPLPNRNWRITPAFGQLSHRVAARFQQEYLHLKNEQGRFLGH
ncbi:hypothetical protein P0082_07800 [Candidatus Haliotispira prima]|uniref:Uncharacterized protein n=1 Tax=Candidatus Haliotispira prima TaxID=3034016 RepID=A0ABY8MEH4_9SPIO|nr:hypothetical protein P0082_07800 [Candidatus Haliotispira prima]